MHLERNITHECLLSQSVSVLSSFKSSLMMVCLNKERRLKRLFYLLYTCEMLDTNYVKFKTEKNLCTFLSSASHLLRGGEGHKILPLDTKYFVNNTLKKGKN